MDKTKLELRSFCDMLELLAEENEVQMYDYRAERDDEMAHFCEGKRAAYILVHNWLAHDFKLENVELLSI